MRTSVFITPSSPISHSLKVLANLWIFNKVYCILNCRLTICVKTDLFLSVFINLIMLVKPPVIVKWNHVYVYESFYVLKISIFLFIWSKCKNYNIVKYYYNLRTVFYFNIISNVIYFCDSKAEFSAVITPVFSVTWSFRNDSDMLIWCSVIIHFLVLLNY